LPQAARVKAATIDAKTSDLFIFQFLDECLRMCSKWLTENS
jgi:hypothetical protein